MSGGRTNALPDLLQPQASASAAATPGKQNPIAPAPPRTTQELAMRMAGFPAANAGPAPIAGDSAENGDVRPASPTDGKDVAEYVEGKLQAAAESAAANLERVRNGRLSPSEACLRVAPLASEAITALHRLATTEQPAWYRDPSHDTEHHERIGAAMTALYGPAMRLVEAALQVGDAFGPNVGGPVLTSLLHQVVALGGPLGFQPAATLEEADALAAPPQEACPSGSTAGDMPHCNLSDDTRTERRALIEQRLGDGLLAFFDACNEERARIEAAIARSNKFAEIMQDVAVGAIVGLTFEFGGAALGADAAAGEGAAVETSHAAGATSNVAHAAAHAEGAGKLTRKVAADQLKDITKTVMKAGIGEDADQREKTIHMLASLKNAAIVGKQDALSKILNLTDEDLTMVWVHVKALTPADYAKPVHDIVARYSEQVQPIGEQTTLGGTVVEKKSAWITGNGRRRLALIDVSWDPSLTAMAVRAGLAGAAMVRDAAHGRGPGKQTPTLAEWREFVMNGEVSIGFESWIDDDLAPAAGAASALDVPIERISTDQDDARVGLGG